MNITFIKWYGQLLCMTHFWEIYKLHQVSNMVISSDQVVLPPWRINRTSLNYFQDARSYTWCCAQDEALTARLMSFTWTSSALHFPNSLTSTEGVSTSPNSSVAILIYNEISTPLILAHVARLIVHHPTVRIKELATNQSRNLLDELSTYGLTKSPKGKNHEAERANAHAHNSHK